MFDQGKTGFIETNRVAAILNTMGQQFDSTELAVTIEEADKEGKFQLKFEYISTTITDFNFDRNRQVVFRSFLQHCGQLFRR